MISSDGEVLFSAEFKEEPTVAINGRFIVKNSVGLYEYYTAEKKPRKIGGEYVEAALFTDDVAPVVRKDHGVELIDKDGNTVCSLDNAEGRHIQTVSDFSEGLAVITTADGVGCIDTKGNIVIKPVYASIGRCSEGKMIAVDAKYRGKSSDELKFCVLDKKGNVTAEFSVKNMKDRGECFKEGCLPVSVIAEDGTTEAGLIGADGEWVVKPSSKTRDVSDVYNNHFIYSDGDGYGLKNIDGETVIRAKYRSLVFGSDDVLIFENDKGEYGIIDIEGNKLTGDTFNKAYGLFKKKYMLTRMGRNNWELIDIEGNSVSRKTDIYDISLGFGPWTVHSDFFAYETLFGEIGITADTFGKMNFGMKADEIAVLCSEGKDEDGLLRKYTGSSMANYGINVLGCSVTVGAVFKGKMVEVSDSAPMFADITPTMLSIILPSFGKIAGKTNETFVAVKAYVAKLGKLIREDTANAVYQLKGDRCICVAVDGTSVALFMGDKNILGVVGATSPASDETSEAELDEFQPDDTPANNGAKASASSTPISQLLSTRKLTYSDISSFSPAQLRILRNEIYARHGYIFKSADLKAHFSRYPWYKPRYTDVTSMMSDIEKYNAQFIKKYE